ncbi:MAG: ATP-binding cassette domain-containing protein [Acetatifactor sp.]
MSEKWKTIMRKAFIAAFWLMLWWGLSLWMDNDILLVSPLKAFARLMELLTDGTVFEAAGRTLGRIALGFFGGFAAATLLAVLSAKYCLAEELLSPMISLLTAVPVASFAVLLLIWWGPSFLAVAISFLIVFPAIYTATLQGIHSVDEKMLEMAKVFRMPLWNRLFYLYRPGVRPFLVSSLKVAVGMSWKSGVAAELIGVPAHSLGEQLYLSKVYLDTAGVFAWTAVVVVLCFLFEKAVLSGMECFFDWQPDCRAVNDPGKISGHRSTDFPYSETGSISGDAAAVVIRNLHKEFDGKTLFSVTECTLKPGQIYRLNAPSGSGKTTFLRILAGLEPYRGSIQRKTMGMTDIGADSSEHSEMNTLPLCSMCFQEDRLCEEISAVKNVAMVVGDEKRAREALAPVLSVDDLDKPCKQLSGGMRRRVAVVRAMEAPGEIVLLDEPYNGLDPENRRKVKDYILSGQRGRVILLASHVPEEKSAF